MARILCRVNLSICQTMKLQRHCAILQVNPGAEMIQLTRLNNTSILVNSDLIKFVEQSPDTFVTLTTGEKLVVREKASEVLARVIDFRRCVLQGLSLYWDSSSAHASEKTPAADHGSQK